MKTSRSMCASMPLIALALSWPASGGPDDQRLHVAVDPRVELMSVIFRFAGNPEYNQGRLESYLDDLEEHFELHREHDVVQMARTLRRTRGVSFDAVMSMAIHLTDAFELGERVPFDDPGIRLDSRWRADEARRFLELARQFVHDSDFRAFMERHRTMHELAAERMTAMIDEHADLSWFDRFFGDRPAARFSLIPAPVNGGQAYGPSVLLPSGEEELYAIIGVWQVDAEGSPQFDKRVLPTVIHEFCHSYVNHVVERHDDALRGAGERIFPLVERAMRGQAYGNWRTMMKESVVRAAVVRYLMAHDEQTAQGQLHYEGRRGFVWMADLVALFDEYVSDREQWPNLDAFMPRIVAFFDEQAPKLEELLRADRDGPQANAPQVVSISPANGAADVDPATSEIIITFDRPMTPGSYSVMLSDAGQEAFPSVLSVGFDETARVFTMRVKLEPGRAYSFTLNSEEGGAFRSADGARLAVTPVQFTTRAAR